MNRFTRFLVVGVILGAVLACGATAAQAAWPAACGSGLGGPSAYPGYGLYNSSWWGGSPYSLGQIPMPPYFSLHPPVYYSCPVPRSYGYSPFAYPGSTPTPEISVQAEVVENPHVEPASTTPRLDQTARTWRMVHNPFAIEPSDTQLASVVGGNPSGQQ
jgi:hypothetical protein